MILLFLGSWRSTLIIATSIPLAILGSILGLSALGQTLNIMTLGGLYLAVGILVDDATVTIENINWHLEHGKAVKTAILDGAHQIVTPAFVSLLCICIVFVPMFFLGGIAGFLFVPMAEAVMFAMTQFIHSLAHAGAHHGQLPAPAATGGGACRGGGSPPRPPSRNPLVHFQRRGFETRFEGLRHLYRELLTLALDHRGPLIPAFLAVVLLSFLLIPLSCWAKTFSRRWTPGRLNILRARAGGYTHRRVLRRSSPRIEEAIRRAIPPNELGNIVDNIADCR